MGGTGMATAAGTAVLVYLVLSGRLCGDAAGDGGGDDQLISSAVTAAAEARRKRKEEARDRRRRRARRPWPERAPGGWGEAASVAARTVRFTWAETLGKWTLGEVAFGIKYYMRQQGNLQHEYAGSDSVLLDGPELLKPAFTVVRDRSSKCFLLFIRGAISVKERLTAATGAEIIGHSMGAAIATILTYILRENDKLSSSTCIAFGPAACMTWDLAESGKDFVTTIVNRNDVVPSLGIVSAAKLRTEVMASPWAHDLRKQIQQTRFLGFVNRSVSFIRSHVPFISDPRSKVVDVDMLQSQSPEGGRKPSVDTHAVVKKRPALVCWSCVAPQKQTVESSKQTQDRENQTDTNVKTVKVIREPAAEPVPIDLCELNLQESDNEDADKEEKESTLKETEDAMELLESLTDDKQELLPSTSAQEPQQLYPPGRILHMVGLQAAAEATTSEQGSQEEVVTLYETPRHLYSKIRLARPMIREHYMPKYIKTMEQLIEKIAEEDIEDQLDSL
ncbi:hypothetical protein HU200_003271 [Digitaria exilis]|uniref:Fungal lipase-like domain-containing protein n=1 Tax=Digitaria exilis TaxID=1010633 RepID=A0A835FU20_9POAL|nr:hypothetical protein HU200_003271 [Digitaria exilis]